jgi:pyruvate dehydrogenase E2 component (dihydrolipoamide acetyltransferase)
MEAALVALGLPVHVPPSRRPAVDSRKQPPSRPARLPLRGAEPGAGSVTAAPAAQAPGGSAAGQERAPRFDLKVTVDATRLLGLQAELNQQTGVDVGLTDLVVKACAGLLAVSPELNASFGGDRLLVRRRVDVGVAVVAEDATLVTAVRDADRKSVVRIAQEVAELAGRARAGQLGEEEAGTAAFTVSSLGVDQFTAVLEPSEGAVLAVGAAHPEPRVVDGQVEARQVLRLTLSIDHRVVDGATGGRFLGRLKDALEQPLQIVA